MTGGRPIKARGVTVQEVKPANYVPQGLAFKMKWVFFKTYYSDYMKQFQSGFKDKLM